MAKNDTILLDGIIDERLAEGFPSSRRDEVFEYFAMEQVLKDFDLSREEIEAGWTDGRDDGGIDGFFTIINGRMLRDHKNFAWPKRSSEIEIWIVSCKHHDTFLQATVEAMLASVPELFDLNLDRAEFKGSYSSQIIAARDRFAFAYRHLSPTRPTLSVHFVYASRGDSNSVGTSVRARADQVIAATKDLFSFCGCSFDFCGGSELISQFRKIKTFSIDLPFVDSLSSEKECHVLLVRLDEYFRFISDQDGGLRRYLFDSNVRDYLGFNRVNEDILSSLDDPTAPDFWWLNNGVTILATRATPVGSRTLQLDDIQIVNGLQTTETLYRYFEKRDEAHDRRSILVKVVVSSDTSVRDQIIRATNNQSQVELASLHATDKIQRDIEEILERHEFYYERRKNYFRNVGKPAARFVTPMFLAAGYVSLGMHNPLQAARLKQRFMKNQESYEHVFSEDVPLGVWPQIVAIVKRVESGLEKVRPAKSGERFLSLWRNLIAFLCVAKVTGTFSYSLADLVGFSVTSITHDLIADIWKLASSNGWQAGKPSSKEVFVSNCCAAASREFGIRNPESIAKRKLPHDGNQRRRDETKRRPPADSVVIPEDFLRAVDAALPEQPWKPGVHREVAEKLQCHQAKVYSAIEELIVTQRRNVQRDGIVFGLNGEILAVDNEREIIPPESGENRKPR